MKYLLTFISISLIISLFCNFYQYREKENITSGSNYEIKALLRGVQDQQIEIDKKLGLLTTDSVYNTRIENIHNYYKNNYYDKIHTANDSQFMVLLDSILADNRRTPFPRGN